MSAFAFCARRGTRSRIPKTARNSLGFPVRSATVARQRYSHISLAEEESTIPDHVTTDPLATLRANVARYLVGCPPDAADQIVDDTARRLGLPLDQLSAAIEGTAVAARHGRATTTLTVRQLAINASGAPRPHSTVPLGRAGHRSGDTVPFRMSCGR